MNLGSDVLWLSVSPHLKCFDQRLLAHLAKDTAIRRWEYCQTIDEPCCVDAVVDLLNEYVCDRTALAQRLGNPNYKVHLIGHGVSGTVGLFYARRYPQHVASLTLLSVGVLPAINWQAHYYAMRQRLPCSREMLLGQLAKILFGQQPHRFAKALAQLLANDLDGSLSLHSLARQTKILPGGVEVPLLVCNGAQDPITTAQQQSQWQRWMKSGDHLWECPEGNHFFHFHNAPITAAAITDFWSELHRSDTASAHKRNTAKAIVIPPSKIERTPQNTLKLRSYPIDG
ncbi:MAG: alpha/beta hydrolase [Cyanobacteria bacterium J06606_4]